MLKLLRNSSLTMCTIVTLGLGHLGADTMIPRDQLELQQANHR